MKLLHLLCLPLLVAASQQAGAAQASHASLARQGKALAKARCSECHSVERYGLSPRSNAPAFPVIANHEGLTARTLSTWLRGAHNYPSEMDFQLNTSQVDRLVAYMLTLKDPHYRRPAD